MRRRLYFLVPDVPTAHKIVEELLVARVEESHIHVLAREGTPLEELPEATLTQRSDLVPSLQRGAAIGGATGVLAGLTAVAIPGGVVAAGAALLGLGAAGAGIGAWASSLIGISAPNSRLKEYEDAIERGELLMLVDVETDRVEEIENLITKHHPEAEIAGTDPTPPPLP